MQPQPPMYAPSARLREELMRKMGPETFQLVAALFAYHAALCVWWFQVMVIGSPYRSMSKENQENANKVCLGPPKRYALKVA